MKLWIWSRSVDFRLRFPLQSFCVLCFKLSEFLTKDILKCIVNPTYLIGCSNCALINHVLKTIITTTHKMGCCKYWYWLGWYNLWSMKLRSLNYPLSISRIAVPGRYYMTTFSKGERFFSFFFNWDSLHERLNSHYEAWSYKKKKHKKD